VLRDMSGVTGQAAFAGFLSDSRSVAWFPAGEDSLETALFSETLISTGRERTREGAGTSSLGISNSGVAFFIFSASKWAFNSLACFSFSIFAKAFLSFSSCFSFSLIRFFSCSNNLSLLFSSCFFSLLRFFSSFSLLRSSFISFSFKSFSLCKASFLSISF